MESDVEYSSKRNLWFFKNDDLLSEDRRISIDWENFYDENYLDELVSNDCINSEEEAFMRGYEN
jgi:hypothetical protein